MSWLVVVYSDRLTVVNCMNSQESAEALARKMESPVEVYAPRAA